MSPRNFKFLSATMIYQLYLYQITKDLSLLHKLFISITISLQPNVAELRYFKLWIVLDQMIQVWNIKGFHRKVAKQNDKD